MLERLDATHASVAWAVRVASGFGQLTKWEADDSVTSPRIAEPWLRLVREGHRKAHEVRPWFVPRVSKVAGFFASLHLNKPAKGTCMPFHTCPAGERRSASRCSPWQFWHCSFGWSCWHVTCLITSRNRRSSRSPLWGCHERPFRELISSPSGAQGYSCTVDGSAAQRSSGESVLHFPRVEVFGAGLGGFLQGVSYCGCTKSCTS